MKTCINHPDRKIRARGLCNSCYDRWLRENNPAYKAKQQEVQKKWRESNSDGKYTAYKQKRNERLKSTPEGITQRRNKTLKRYGLTNEKYKEILDSQGGACKICQRKQDKNFHVDHCHTTGEVRGLLCAQCNWFVGKIDRNPTVFENLKNYLWLNKKEKEVFGSTMEKENGPMLTLEV